MASVATAQPSLRLKGWNPESSQAPVTPFARKTRTPGRSHFLVRFTAEPSEAQLKGLADRGASVLSYIPDSALSIAISDGVSLSGLGIQWIGRLHPDEKVSRDLKETLAASDVTTVLVEFYADVLEGDARSIANETGTAIHDNPDLLPHHLLIEGTADQIRRMADWDEVSYIFPASAELIQGLPVHGCAGALTRAGPVGQAVPLVGDGWDGPGLGSASLSYAFVYVTQKAPADSVESEIERAYAEWAKCVQVTFTQTSDTTGPQTLAVLFASGAHGDGYPFDGPGGVLAHTFYPYPLNPEPIAGDMHFDNDESWKIGANVDVFTVALHETGHALGLGHSDSPGDVMYPYYRMRSALGPGDIAAIQQQYAATVASTDPVNPVATPPVSIPLTLGVVPPQATTSATSIALSGTTAGGSGTTQVSWSTNPGAGTAQGSLNWTIAAIPLSVGANVITLTARDSKQDQVSQTVTVTSQPASAPADNPAPPAPPASPGTGVDTAPPSITIQSPAITTFATSASSIAVSGTAQDNVGVVQVTWSSSTGGSGTASGTNNWNTGPVPLYVGITTIIVYASDAAGNQAWRSVTVTRQ